MLALLVRATRATRVTPPRHHRPRLGGHSVPAVASQSSRQLASNARRLCRPLRRISERLRILKPFPVNLHILRLSRGLSVLEIRLHHMHRILDFLVKNLCIPLEIVPTLGQQSRE